MWQHERCAANVNYSLLQRAGSLGRGGFRHVGAGAKRRIQEYSPSPRALSRRERARFSARPSRGWESPQLATRLCRRAVVGERIRLGRSSTYRARAFRAASTPAEERLWAALRRRAVADAKFRRQHPIGRFVVDFFCVDAQLAVEADGASHFPTPPEDVARDALLATSGVLVLRFSNDELLTDPERVLRAIEKHVRARRQYGRP